MQSTLRDYARLVQAVLSGEIPPKKERKMMLSPQIRIHFKHEFPSLAEEKTTDNDAIRLSYGLGWGLYRSPYGEAFFKEGHDEGWRHYVVCFDKPKTGILIVTNSSNGEDLYSGLLQNLIRGTFTPLEWEGFKSLCDDHAYFVIPIPRSRERNLALGIFRAVRDSSSSANENGGLLGMTRKLGFSHRLFKPSQGVDSHRHAACGTRKP